MSRNKDIKILHLLTDLPYSVCRERLKRNRWDLLDALMEGTVFYEIGKATRELVEAVCDSLITALAHVFRKSQELLEIIMEKEGESDEDDND